LKFKIPSGKTAGISLQGRFSKFDNTTKWLYYILDEIYYQILAESIRQSSR